MVNCHAEIGRLGCDTILDITQTSLTACAMLEYSLASVFIYVRHGCTAKIVQVTVEPYRLALEYVWLCIEFQLDTSVGGGEKTAVALTCFPAMRLYA